MVPTQTFKYTGLAMNNLSPANGATVTVPTLRWDVTPGALTYTVVIKFGGNQVDTATTHATSYTPKGQTRLAPGTYTWTVYAETAEGTSHWLLSAPSPSRHSAVDGRRGPDPAEPVTDRPVQRRSGADVGA